MCGHCFGTDRHKSGCPAEDEPEHGEFYGLCRFCNEIKHYSEFNDFSKKICEECYVEIHSV